MSLSHPSSAPTLSVGVRCASGFSCIEGISIAAARVCTPRPWQSSSRPGHHVEVFSGPPYPHIDEAIDGVALHQVSSMDLYPTGGPFRMPWPWEFSDLIDVGEVGIMSAAGYPEPWAFSKRIRSVLAPSTRRL